MELGVRWTNGEPELPFQRGGAVAKGVELSTQVCTIWIHRS